MLAIELPKEVEQHFYDVVNTRYHGNMQEAMLSLLQLHDRYGWKEQFQQDVAAIRTEVRNQGGVTEEAIDAAIRTYRH